MNRLVLLLSFFLAVHLSSADETMTKIVYRGVEPRPPVDTFAAMPKTLYRIGSTCGRTEEAYDSAMNLQGLLIANGKNIWFINLATKTGKHFVNPEPTEHDFQASLVPPVRDGKNQVLPAKDFELGREVEFMKSRNITLQVSVENGEKIQLYEAIEDGFTLRVYISPKTQLPIGSAVLKRGKMISRLAYDEYQLGLKPDRSLFRPPEGIDIVDVK